MSGPHDVGGGASRTTDPAAGTSSATDVSLREYFNEKIGADRKLNNERFLFAGVIGAVIWFFIERHLTDLNHENARVARISESSVSSDTYRANEQQRKDEQKVLGDRLAKYDEQFTKVATRDDLTRETKTEKRSEASLDWQRIAVAIAIVVAAMTLLSFYIARTTTPDKTPIQIVTVTTPQP